LPSGLKEGLGVAGQRPLDGLICRSEQGLAGLPQVVGLATFRRILRVAIGRLKRMVVKFMKGHGLSSYK
jgi:hypothetical protein